MLKLTIILSVLMLCSFEPSLSDSYSKEPEFTEREIKVSGGILAKERLYTESGTAIFDKPGDYSVERKSGGIENFRISEKEIKPRHEVRVEQGDKVTIEPPTLKK